MRMPAIHVTFSFEAPLILPINYQHLLQSFVYKILPQEEATQLHEEGFQHNNRTYKLFCFSSLQSPKTLYDKNTKKITFHDKIILSISSIIPEIIEKTANFLILSEDLKIRGYSIKLHSLEFDKLQVNEDTLIVKAVSPITVYSTYEKRDGKKITHYFTPFDKVFEHLIEENFIRKYEAFTKKPLSEQGQVLSVEPIKVNKWDKVVTNYKGTWITGWKGKYQLKAKAEYLSFLLNTGLASKNSSGFGMILPENTLPTRD
ncbi:CRISPR-associated endoribonuclease Cas6 [Pueribacillus theae]|uniref:CRISPR-associated endoribonuclease n=2 Tax=Pueribacillus theae TaxID=2171751 RepID=A0A2U1K6E7_9BACI|nr:CRISPR-associated endoribonuclease Cas6 [Pueribacillus theae]